MFSHRYTPVDVTLIYQMSGSVRVTTSAHFYSASPDLNIWTPIYVSDQQLQGDV